MITLGLPNAIEENSAPTQRSVAGEISGGETPLTVPDGMIDDTRLREAWFRKGDKTPIVDGAVIDLVGLFECPSDLDRGVLLPDLLDRGRWLAALRDAPPGKRPAW